MQVNLALLHQSTPGRLTTSTFPSIEAGALPPATSAAPVIGFGDRTMRPIIVALAVCLGVIAVIVASAVLGTLTVAR